jgi:hypothetical protein
MTRLTPSPNGQHAGPGFATLPKLQFVAPTAKPPPPTTTKNSPATTSR